MIDPKDFRSVYVIEDALDVRCFCGSKDRFDPYCPIHGADQTELVRAIEGVNERFEELEHEREEAEEKREDARDEASELRERVDKAERDSALYSGQADDLTFAIEQALAVLEPSVQNRGWQGVCEACSLLREALAGLKQPEQPEPLEHAALSRAFAKKQKTSHRRV